MRTNLCRKRRDKLPPARMLRLVMSKASKSLSTFKGNKLGTVGKRAKKNPSSLLGCTSDFTFSIPPRFRTQRNPPRFRTQRKVLR